MLFAPMLGGFLTSLSLFFVRLFSKILIVGVGLGLAKVLGFLGVGLVTYTGTMYGVEYFVSIIQQNFDLFPAQYRQLIFAVFTDLRVDSAFSLIISAYAIRLAVMSATKLRFSPSVGG